MNQPATVEQYDHRISQLKEWLGQGIPPGSPVSVRGTVKNAFPIETKSGQYGDYSYQNFYLQQDDGEEIKVHWSSPEFDLTAQQGAVLLLGQWNKGGQQGGKCVTDYYQDTVQLKVGASCLKLEESVQAQASIAPPPSPVQAPSPPPAQNPVPAPTPPGLSPGAPATQGGGASPGRKRLTIDQFYDRNRGLFDIWYMNLTERGISVDVAAQVASATACHLTKALVDNKVDDADTIPF